MAKRIIKDEQAIEIKTGFTGNPALVELTPEALKAIHILEMEILEILQAVFQFKNNDSRENNLTDKERSDAVNVFTTVLFMISKLKRDGHLSGINGMEIAALQKRGYPWLKDHSISAARALAEENNAYVRAKEKLDEQDKD